MQIKGFQALISGRSNISRNSLLKLLDAGRHGATGQVLIQTRRPDSEWFDRILRQDYHLSRAMP